MRMQLLGKAATIPYTTIDYALSLAQALDESDPRAKKVRALNQDLVVHFPCRRFNLSRNACNTH